VTESIEEPLERLYTPKELAEYFGVTEYTIRQWLADGDLRGFKIGKGKYWRIPESAVKEKALERHGEVS